MSARVSLPVCPGARERQSFLADLPSARVFNSSREATKISLRNNTLHRTFNPITISIMASPFSSDIPKPFGSTEKLVKDVNRAFALPVPAFGDLGKAANDVRILLGM